MTVKIKNLVPGESAIIAGYETGNNYYRQKLLSMGLIKGTIVTLIKTAPLGDPVQMELRGFKLSLRKKEADILILEKDETFVQPCTGFFNNLRRKAGFPCKGGRGHGSHGRGCGREAGRGRGAGHGAGGGGLRAGRDEGSSAQDPEAGRKINDKNCCA
ncbi:MAG: ferrous iron transport protein A [Spirochaetia bacterium]|nr:ferrous iron transport protein A [Spirochaetia bacterium]